jgi:hypothetical protein
MQADRGLRVDKTLASCFLLHPAPFALSLLPIFTSFASGGFCEIIRCKPAISKNDPMEFFGGFNLKTEVPPKLLRSKGEFSFRPSEAGPGIQDFQRIPNSGVVRKYPHRTFSSIRGCHAPDRVMEIFAGIMPEETTFARASISKPLANKCFIFLNKLE